MATCQFTIRLASDAEPGTGLGSEVINDLIPREHHRRPVLPATHIKGLMRDALEEMVRQLRWPEELVTRVFGGLDLEEDEAGVGVEAGFRLTAATASSRPQVALVARTSVELSTGVAKDATLRTTEAIPVGTEFHGSVHSAVPKGCAEDLAWRLALLSIPAVGGSRNRGCGACVVEIADEQRSPGQLLRMLAATLRSDAWRARGLVGRIPQRATDQQRPASCCGTRTPRYDCGRPPRCRIRWPRTGFMGGGRKIATCSRSTPWRR